MVFLLVTLNKSPSASLSATKKLKAATEFLFGRNCREELNLAAQNETVSPAVAEMARQIENGAGMPPF